MKYKKIICFVIIISFINNLILTFDTFSSLINELSMFTLKSYVPNINVKSFFILVIRFIIYFIFFVEVL